MSITMDQFTEYCSTSSQYTERRTSNATPHTGPVHTLQSSLDDWKKGVKPDMTLYPILKHDRQFDTWNRVTKAVPDTQGLSNVLDPKYAPTAIDAIALFKEQKIFMFAVFSKILLTDQGKKIVRAHEIDFDAQVIYEDIGAVRRTDASSTGKIKNANTIQWYLNPTASMITNCGP
jgi:hypothetical protein